MVSGVVAGCDKLGRVIIKAFLCTMQLYDIYPNVVRKFFPPIIHDKPFIFMQFPFTQSFGGTQSVSRWQSKINIVFSV